MTNAALTTYPTLNLVQKAYSGKAGKCRCGCAGKYYTPADGKNANTQIKRIWAKIEAAYNLNPNAVEVGPDWINLEEAGRYYTIYAEDAKFTACATN